MKNLFLGLFMLAGTAMFASNNVEAFEVKKESSETISTTTGGLCTVIIRGYNSDGEVVGSRIHTLPAENQNECDRIGDSVLALYQMGVLKL